MDFELILHGKPNAGSHIASNGLDKNFCDNLVDKFFQSMGSIKDAEVLIVDTRNWKNVWYSVYTFWLGGNVRDTAGRASFLAISMVVPKQYMCLNSVVFSLLKDAVKECVGGTYIDNSRQYIVQDLNNSEAFQKLFNYLSTQFVNLNENLDNTFRGDIQAGTECRYHLMDCDSKAFVEDLKKHGRVFVSPTYGTKDALVVQYLLEAQTKQADLQTKDRKISELNKHISELNSQLEAAKKKQKESDETIAGLRQQIGDLNNQVASLNKSNQALQKQIAELLKRLGKKPINPGPVIPGANHPVRLKSKPLFKTAYLRWVNTCLLVVILLLFCFKSCDSSSQQIASLQQEVTEIHQLIKGNKPSEQSQPFGMGTEGSQVVVEGKDIDCGLELYQNDQQVSKDEINIQLPLIIKVSTPMDGYEFHTDNLVQSQIEIATPFELKKKDPSKPIVISYRTANLKNANENNFIKIK
ncbi:MAG: hypothetical protein ACI30R_00230 [Sodaliphilus sp.]